MNQWHNYKEVCLRSQDKLQQWLEQNLQSSPMVSIHILLILYFVNLIYMILINILLLFVIGCNN